MANETPVTSLDVATRADLFELTAKDRMNDLLEHQQHPNTAGDRQKTDSFARRHDQGHDYPQG